jgi:transposase-like protein
MSKDKGSVELLERATRRRFTKEYKLELLRRAEECQKPGQVGALLRSEGLYSSHLSIWRKQRDAMAAAGLSEIRRGRAKKDPRDETIARLENEVARQKARAERAELIVDFQKKVSQILGVVLPDDRERS